MAGGIDWFRWHHGSVTDPKFRLVARKAGASLPEVLAVWAFLLEKASAADFRGCFGEVDTEAVDCLFGLSDGTTDAILDAMVDRKLIADQYVVAWEKRQPKREDETAAERKRRQREREHEIKVAESVTGRSVTQCHAESRSVPAGHDRGEESRGEVKDIVPTALPDSPAAPRADACPTQAIVDLFHKRLPMLPRVAVLSESRKRAISARWREVVSDPEIRRAQDPKSAALDWFDWLFGYVAQSRFLSGKATDWRADIDFLMTPAKFAKVVEGHYHKEHA